MRRWAIVAMGCALWLGPAGSARADANHYVNLLVGDRATGLGGAYTALSEDASGLFYNPAGTVYAGDLSISANVNAYRETNTEFAGVLGGQGWTRKSSALVPNFFGVVVPAGGFHLGFSYAVPDSTTSDQDQEFHDLAGTSVARFRINFNEADTTYNFGPSVAVRIADWLPLGLTLYGHLRQRELISNQLVSLADGTSQSLGFYLDSDEYGLRPVLGTVLELGDHAGLGLTAARTYVLHSSTRVQNSVKNPGEEGVTETVETTGEKRVYPYRFAAGLAWFPTNAFLLSADLIVHTATTDEAFGNREATWNWALGTEAYFSSAWAWRGGVFSDRANTPELASTRTDQLEHVNLYGVSTSVTHYTATSALTLGTIYQQGSGEAQLIGNSTSIQDVDVSSLMVFLSAAYRH